MYQDAHTPRPDRHETNLLRDGLSATYHAALRYLERVDPRESFPEERLRQLAERAEAVDRDDVDGEALLDEQTGVLLVYDRDAREIVTVWRADDE